MNFCRFCNHDHYGAGDTCQTCRSRFDAEALRRAPLFPRIVSVASDSASKKPASPVPNPKIQKEVA